MILTLISMNIEYTYYWYTGTYTAVRESVHFMRLNILQDVCNIRRDVSDILEWPSAIRK